jgi:hypothetical protein
LKAIAAFWNRHFLLLEGLCGAAALGCFAAWARWFGGTATIINALNGNRGAIYSSLASIFGSLLGFVITAASIVITTAGSDRMALVRNSVHYKTLWRVFIQAMAVLAYATVASLVALITDRDASPNWISFYLCLAGAIFAALRMYRCLWVMIQIIHLFIADRE